MANKKPLVPIGTAPNFTGIGELLTTDRLEGIVNEGDYSNNSVIIKTGGGTIQPTVMGTNTILGNIGAGLTALSTANIKTLLNSVYALNTKGQVLAYDTTASALVPITPGTNGQALVFDSTVTGGIKAANIASALSALTGVVLTAPATAEVLRYNGTNFVNAKLNFADLGDIDLTGLANGYTLIYDSVAVKWEAQPISVTSGVSDVGQYTSSNPLDMNNKAIQEVTRIGFNAGILLASGNNVWLAGETGGNFAFAINALAPEYVLTLKSDKDVQFHDYANTRDDSGTTAPINFLYTNASGLMLSSPVSELAIPAGLDDLDDVDLTTAAPVDGQFLKFVVDEWVPAAAPTASFITTATATLNMANNNLDNVGIHYFRDYGSGKWSITGNGANALVMSFGASARFSMFSDGALILGAYGSGRADDSATYTITNLLYTTVAGGMARVVLADMPYFRELSGTEQADKLVYISSANELKRLSLADLPAFADQAAATSGGATAGKLWKASAGNTMSVPEGTLIVSP
jgi:hypothetical protein